MVIFFYLICFVIFHFVFWWFFKTKFTTFEIEEGFDRFYTYACFELYNMNRIF